MIQITCAVLFTVCVVCLETSASLGYLWILCLYTFVLGLLLTILICQEIYVTAHDKDQGVWPLTLTIFGFYGSILSALGDKTHYMNRDDPTWSYINIALAGFFVWLSLFFTIPKIQ